jgi:hypothetical protein
LSGHQQGFWRDNLHCRKVNAYQDQLWYERRVRDERHRRWAGMVWIAFWLGIVVVFATEALVIASLVYHRIFGL